MASIADRIERLVERVPESGCWIWMGAINRGGYGFFKLSRKMKCAHRVAYEEFVAPIPKGFEIDHLCRVRCCVNPAHLEPVSARENTLRGNTITRAHHLKTHCIHGHPLSGDNLIFRPGGGRACLECRRVAQRRREADPIFKAKRAAYKRAKRLEMKKMESKVFQVRQGDVLVERIDGGSIPVGATEIPSNGRVILAYGEVTGHCHAVYPESGVLPAKLWDAGAERFLQVMSATTIQHEEHGAIPLTPGIYRVSKFGDGTQREYSPEEIRSVAD